MGSCVCLQAGSIVAEKAFIVACNLVHVAKARLYWKRMTTHMQERARNICDRNGITQDMLDGD